MSNLFMIVSQGPNFASIRKSGQSQCIIYFYSWRFLDPRLFKSFVQISNVRANCPRCVECNECSLLTYASLKCAAFLFYHKRLAFCYTMRTANLSTEIFFPLSPQRPLVTAVIAEDPPVTVQVRFVNWKFSACWAVTLINFNICTFVLLSSNSEFFTTQS